MTAWRRTTATRALRWRLPLGGVAAIWFPDYPRVGRTGHTPLPFGFCRFAGYLVITTPVDATVAFHLRFATDRCPICTTPVYLPFVVRLFVYHTVYRPHTLPTLPHAPTYLYPVPTPPGPPCDVVGSTPTTFLPTVLILSPLGSVDYGTDSYPINIPPPHPVLPSYRVLPLFDRHRHVTTATPYIFTIMVQNQVGLHFLGSHTFFRSHIAYTPLMRYLGCPLPYAALPLPHAGTATPQLVVHHI